MTITDYTNQTLYDVIVTTKLDGVCCLFDGQRWRSRDDKPLYNLPLDVEVGTYECYCGDWESSVSAVRTQLGNPIPHNCLFRLDTKHLDSRLILATVNILTPERAAELLALHTSKGEEGLVYHTDGGIYKHKATMTFDVVVTGWQQGDGRNWKRMGALLTSMGKVGSGFTDRQREEFTKEFIVGKTIEVVCARLTSSGKFWHPRFKRVRIDKS